jgi:hypothetical protein
MITEDEDEGGQARFKVSKGFDFAQTVNWKLFEALHSPRRSSKRADSLKDLQETLSFDWDEIYHQEINDLDKKLRPHGEREIADAEAYNSGLHMVLIGLIKRKGYGGGTDIDLDDEL